MEKNLTFEETINTLFDKTKSIEVVLSGWINCGEKDSAIRSGDAVCGIKYNDPMIGGYSFMICGEVKTMNGKHFGNLDELYENPALAYGNLYVDIYVQSIVRDHVFTIDLGMYEIEKIECVSGGGLFYSDYKYKLKISRKH